MPKGPKGEKRPADVQIKESDPMWLVMCEDRISAQTQRARFMAFVEAHVMPPAEQAIVEGCTWAMFTLRLPIEDTDLEPVPHPHFPHSVVRYYRAAATFVNERRRGETVEGAYIQLPTVIAATLKSR